MLCIDLGAAESRKVNDRETLGLVRVSEQHVVGRPITPGKCLDSPAGKQMARR
jgi:hypothetical protein